MYNIGLDIGYGYTKTDAGVIFPSKIQEGGSIIGDGIEIDVDGSRYLVGYGKGTLDLNKIDNTLNKICMLAAISKSTDDEEVNIATGLPISQVKMYGEQFRKYLLDNSSIRYSVNGINRYVRICDVKVFPQGAGALYAYDIVGDVIIVDIGSRTVDIAYFEYMNGKRKLVKYNTIFKGMVSLYSKIVELVNKKYNLSLDDEYGEKILTNGLSLFGETQDLSWLQPVYDAHVNEIIDTLMLNYPYVSTDVYLCGGGANMLLRSFSKKIKNIQVLKDSQFSNALGFKKLADSIWRDRINQKPNERVITWQHK